MPIVNYRAPHTLPGESSDDPKSRRVPARTGGLYALGKRLGQKR